MIIMNRIPSWTVQRLSSCEEAGAAWSQAGPWRSDTNQSVSRLENVLISRASVYPAWKWNWYFPMSLTTQSRNVALASSVPLLLHVLPSIATRHLLQNFWLESLHSCTKCSAWSDSQIGFNSYVQCQLEGPAELLLMHQKYIFRKVSL